MKPQIPFDKRLKIRYDFLRCRKTGNEAEEIENHGKHRILYAGAALPASGVLLREIARIPENPRSFHVSGAETDRTFLLTDSWLYVFRSGVAFLALGVMFDQIETLADIVNLGGVGSRAAFSFEDAGGRPSICT